MFVLNKLKKYIVLDVKYVEDGIIKRLTGINHHIAMRIDISVTLNMLSWSITIDKHTHNIEIIQKNVFKTMGFSQIPIYLIRVRQWHYYEFNYMPYYLLTIEPSFMNPYDTYYVNYNGDIKNMFIINMNLSQIDHIYQKAKMISSSRLESYRLD